MKKLMPPPNSDIGLWSPLFENQINEKLLTARELAEKLSISISYLKKLKRQGAILPAISFGRFVRYRLTEVVTSLKRSSNHG